MPSRAALRRLLSLLLAACAATAGCASRPDGPSERPPAIEKGLCSPLTREVLDASLALGTRYMLNHQQPDGRFSYMYDWVARRFAPGDSQVRQAGSAWGLATIHQDAPNVEVAAALEKSLAFFAAHSRLTPHGKRYIVYPNQRQGRLGTVALVALAHVDYLRRAEHLEDAAAAAYRGHLREYLGFLIAARGPDGRFHASYSLRTGKPFGPPSPYFDGEALLALTKAAKYLGRDDLRPIVLEAADAGYRLNVEQARENDPDSKVTKGYYQWSSMAYFELATSGWPETEKYGGWLIELADWMIDVHRTLERTRNTAYAYEGIVPAYRMAEIQGDARHMKKFGCTLEQGLAKLTSWQVGSPTANDFISGHLRASGAITHEPDPLALGGIQNHRAEAPLRIDVVQHQMHAVVLARRFYYTEPWHGLEANLPGYRRLHRRHLPPGGDLAHRTVLSPGRMNDFAGSAS